MSKLCKVLALDDDLSWLSQIPLILEDDCEVTAISSIDQAIQAIQGQFYEIILLDMNFENDPRSGIDLFRMIQAADRGADVIVISGETKPERLIQIMNAGVTSFLPKPALPASIRQAVRKSIEQRQLKIRALEMQDAGSSTVLIGKSLAMQKLRDEISKVVSSGIKDILLIGETGTGKEVVAKCIAYSADPSKRFIPMHCGAITDSIAESELFGHVKGAFTGADRDKIGAFEAAGGGYVFLDEIGDMPLNQQAKLLRVLQERKVQKVGSHDEISVNFRTISATHVNIDDAISKKTFREDLFYRLAKAQIRIPSLRDRLEDIPALVSHFLRNVDLKKQFTITNDALDLLAAYHWPGNVRQLQAVIEGACCKVADNVIREKDLCQVLPQLANIFGNKSTKMLVSRFGGSILCQERDRYERVLRECNGNRDVAADKLGLSRATFFRRLKELGMVKERVKPPILMKATLSATLG
jgi:DNA-binding NtrC family response regulator